MRGKGSLRHEPPHTRNPGLMRATVHPGDSFWRETSKQPGDRALGVFGFFSTLFVTVFVQYNSFVFICNLHKIVSTCKWYLFVQYNSFVFICNLHKIASTSKWYFVFLLHSAGGSGAAKGSGLCWRRKCQLGLYWPWRNTPLLSSEPWGKNRLFGLRNCCVKEPLSRSAIL